MTPQPIDGALLTLNSLDLAPLLDRCLLALKLPAQCRRVLHLGHVAIPRSCRGRVTCRTHVIHLPQLCHFTSPGRFREWFVDECRRILGYSNDIESVLEICFPLH